MHPAPIQKLIDLFSKFPTVGPRTAARFVFYLIKLPENELNDLMKSIRDLKKTIKVCAFCFNPFEGSPAIDEEALCPICKNPGRDRSLLCVVEKEADLISIENIKRYKGLYFILGGAIPTLKKADLEKLRVGALEERIKSPADFGIKTEGLKEIIIATNSTAEGEATALYVMRKVQDLQMPDTKDKPKITRLARGMPVGGELEYADEETLGSAFEGRK